MAVASYFKFIRLIPILFGFLLLSVYAQAYDTNENNGNAGYWARSNLIKIDGTSLHKLYTAKNKNRSQIRNVIDARAMPQGGTRGISLWTMQNQNPAGTKNGCANMEAINIPMTRRDGFHQNHSMGRTGLPYIGDGNNEFSDIFIPYCTHDTSTIAESFFVVNGSTKSADRGGVGFYLGAGSNRLLKSTMYLENLNPALNRAENVGASSIVIRPNNTMYPYSGELSVMKVRAVNEVKEMSRNFEHGKIMVSLKMQSVNNTANDCDAEYGECYLNVNIMHYLYDQTGMEMDAKTKFDEQQLSDSGRKPIISTTIPRNGYYSRFSGADRYENKPFAKSLGNATQSAAHGDKAFTVEVSWGNFVNGLKAITLDRYRNQGLLGSNAKISNITNEQIKTVFGSDALTKSAWRISAFTLRSEYPKHEASDVPYYLGTNWRSAYVQGL